MKKIVGIYQDGLELKLAILEKRNNKIFLVDLITHAVEGHKTFTDNVVDGEKLVLDENSPLVFDKPPDEGESLLSLKSALHKYNIKNLVFIPTVSEPNISYNNYVETIKLNKKNYKKRLTDQWRNYQKSIPDIEKINWVQSPDNSVLSIYTNENFPVIEQLQNLAVDSKYTNLSFPIVYPADILISDYVLNNYKLENEKNYLITHIGTDSTRLIFINDNKVKFISGYLGIGSQTLGIESILISKILLESENAQITKIDKVFISGDLRNESIITEFRQAIDFEEIETINFVDIDISSLPPEAQKSLSTYSFPILSAYNYLHNINKTHSKINLLPKNLIESQKIFKLGIAGYLLLILIFALVTFFTVQFLMNKRTINSRTSQLENLKQYESENQTVIDSVTFFTNKIAAATQIKSKLDTLVVGSERYTQLLDKINMFELHKKRMWLTSITNTPELSAILGLSLNRNVIPSFADYLDYSLLQNIIVTEVRKRTVHKFDVRYNISKYGLKGLVDEP